MDGDLETIVTELGAHAAQALGLGLAGDDLAMVRESAASLAAATAAVSDALGDDLHHEVRRLPLEAPDLDEAGDRSGAAEDGLRPPQARWGLRALVDELRTGAVSSRELVTDVLDRLSSVGPQYNAVVTLTAERAERCAVAADEAHARGELLGPLHGVPYGAKDLIAAAGYPTSWGAALWADREIRPDAAVVSRLENAGAALAAKLATDEIAGGFGGEEPDASLTGPCLNPWDRRAFAGSSSGGPAAAVAAGLVPFALGTETLGSVVEPAAFCGVTGLRLSHGSVSLDGVMPLSTSLDRLGIMAHSADDIALVLGSLSERTPGPSLAQDACIGVVDDALARCAPAVQDAFSAFVDTVASTHRVVRIELPELPYRELGSLLLCAEAAASHRRFLLGGESLKLRSRGNRFYALPWLGLPAWAYAAALELRRTVSAMLADAFRTVDVLLYPTFPDEAPPIDVLVDEWLGDLRTSSLRSAGCLAGGPAVAFPIGVGPRGLPVSACALGRPGADRQLLSFVAPMQEQLQWTRYADLRAQEDRISHA